MNRHTRRGTTLVETIAATIVAATILVPLVGMLRSGAMLEQRWKVRSGIVAHAETILDKIRIATATPAVFTSATYGTLPAGVPSTQTVAIAPGEQATFSVEVSPYDGYRDLLIVTVACSHQATGTQTIAPINFFTAIAKPW